MSRVCILSGASSYLSTTTLLPLFASLNMSVHAVFTEKTRDRARGVTYVSQAAAQAMAANKEFDATLWVSPHSDAATLASFSAHIPTLAINSMSIAAHLMSGKPAESELNAYQHGKLDMYKTEGVTSLFPGFYLIKQRLHAEEAAIQLFSPGLQVDTTNELLRPAGHAFLNPKFDTNKIPMSVTPVEALGQVIAQWVRDPRGTMDPNMFTVFCSNGEYSRDRLRLAALGEQTQPPANLFGNQMHPRRSPHGLPWVVTHEEVEGLMRNNYVKRRKYEEEEAKGEEVQKINVE